MSFSASEHPHSPASSLHHEPSLEHVNSGVSKKLAGDHTYYPHGSLLTARARRQGRFDNNMASDEASGRGLNSLFRHRKQDSISSETRDIPSCRSDDTSGSSTSLESVSSDRPSSPIEKIEVHEFNLQSLPANQTSTPLNSSGLFETSYPNFMSEGIDQLHTNDMQSQGIECNLDFPNANDVQSMLSVDSGIPIHDTTFGACGTATGDVNTGSTVANDFSGQSNPVSPSSMPYVNSLPGMDAAGDTLAGDLNFTHEDLGTDFKLFDTPGGDDFNVQSFGTNFLNIPVDAQYDPYLEQRHDQQHPQLPMQHIQIPRQSQQELNRLFQQQQEKQEQQFQQQGQQQHHQQQQSQQPQQPQQPQLLPQNFSNCHGLAINVPSMPPHKHDFSLENTPAQQPLLPSTIPLHTQLNPPHEHHRRFPEHRNGFYSQHGRFIAARVLQGNINSGRQGISNPSHLFRPHLPFANRRTHRYDGSSDETGFFQNGFLVGSGSGAGQMSSPNSGNDSYQGNPGYQARSKSKSKLPLNDLFVLMKCDAAEGRRREEKVMSILRREGFDLGNKTFIRDTDEAERKRIMAVIVDETKEWGYTYELLEIIVHRGVYARMQSNLRRQRRNDNRAKAREIKESQLPRRDSEPRHGHN